MAFVQKGQLSRRRMLQGAAAVALLPFVAARSAAAAVAPGSTAATPLDPGTVQTLEAYADTIVPGQPRFPGDYAVPGAAPGPSAAAAGAIIAYQMPEVGVAPELVGIAQLINGRAQQYAGANNITLNPSLPPFVALSFGDRTVLAGQMLAAGDPMQNISVLLATFANWTFDMACYEHTADAIATGHPGLAWLGFPAPGSDGLWRFPAFSYGRQLAAVNPNTTSSGSPA